MYVSCQGCEYHGYNSDITRTWPVNGRFSQPQRDLYEAVLSVQTELIGTCTTLPSLDSLFHAMCSLLGLHLQELGVLSSRSTRDELSRVSTSLSPGLSHLAYNTFSGVSGIETF
jgi:Xaa-Pro aminopeptidase